MNNDPCKTLKQYAFGTIFWKNKTKIATHMDL